MDYRQVTKPDGSVLWKCALQMVGERLGLLGIACESGGNGRAVFDFAIARQPESSGRALFRFARIAEESFPKSGPDLELRGPLAIALLLRQFNGLARENSRLSTLLRTRRRLPAGLRSSPWNPGFPGQC